MGKDKKRKHFGVTFSFNKEKKSFGKKRIYNFLDCRNILRTRMNEMISHLLSEVFSSHSWKITVFPQLALLPHVVQYPLSGIKAQLYPSAPPTPTPQRKNHFFHLCVKDLFTHPWNSFLTTCLKVFNLQIVVLTLINLWKSFPFWHTSEIGSPMGFLRRKYSKNMTCYPLWKLIEFTEPMKAF